MKTVRNLILIFAVLFMGSCRISDLSQRQDLKNLKRMHGRTSNFQNVYKQQAKRIKAHREHDKKYW